MMRAAFQEMFYFKFKLENKLIFDVENIEVVRLEKILFKLFELGIYCNATIDYHLTNEPQLSHAIPDQSMFYTI